MYDSKKSAIFSLSPFTPPQDWATAPRTVCPTWSRSLSKKFLGRRNEEPVPDHSGRGEEFRRRLAALFEVSTREVGDVYLMQEVLGRVGFPNRGNKAALSYFPFLAASLAGFDAPGLGDRAKDCLPDLVALAQQGVSGAAQ